MLHLRSLGRRQQEHFFCACLKPAGDADTRARILFGRRGHLRPRDRAKHIDQHRQKMGIGVPAVQPPLYYMQRGCTTLTAAPSTHSRAWTRSRLWPRRSSCSGRVDALADRERDAYSLASSPGGLMQRLRPSSRSLRMDPRRSCSSSSRPAPSTPRMIGEVLDVHERTSRPKERRTCR